jgi:hypothetical protein
MRKIKKKNKNVDLELINKILIAVFLGIYVFIGICIQMNRPNYGETFINLDYDLNDIKNNLIYTYKKYNQYNQSETPIEKEDPPVYEENLGIDDESYIIEQERIKNNRMDKYKIKGQNGNLKFITKGKWDINKLDLKFISVHGGYVDIHKSDSNVYNFELEDYKVHFISKQSEIIGKISINSTENFYLKKYNRSINFYDEFNNRISHGTYFKSEPNVKNENMTHFYKLIFDTKYANYKQIYLIVYLLYLQIHKNENYYYR